MAKNLSGLANTGDYSLGRGIVLESGINPTTELPDTAGWRDLGNCPDFTVQLETETLPHTSSRAGLAVVDKEVITNQTMTLSFTLDEINDQNIANFMSGTTASHTNTAIAGFAANVISSSVTLGRWYDLVNSAGERAYDIDAVDVTATETAGPTSLVLGTDYLLDLAMGRIFLLSTASNIAAGESLTVALAAKAEAATVDEVRGLTQGNIVRAIKFIAENPANNNVRSEYQFHKVTLRSEGDFALISEDWTTMQFTGTVERSELADADAPFCRKRDFAAS